MGRNSYLAKVTAKLESLEQEYEFKPWQGRCGQQVFTSILFRGQEKVSTNTGNSQKIKNK